MFDCAGVLSIASAVAASRQLSPAEREQVRAASAIALLDEGAKEDRALMSYACKQLQFQFACRCFLLPDRGKFVLQHGKRSLI